jgi:lysophospholipase L1-like esterase
MRLVLPWSLTVAFVLAGCGGAEQTPAAVSPISSGSQPVVSQLQNAYVQCRNLSQTLTDFTPPYSQNGHSRWLIIGSSSAYGAGASSYEKSWAGLLTNLAAEQGIEVINIARGGYTTYKALPSECDVQSARPQADLNHNIDQALLQSADLVIVSFPSNDAAAGYTAEESAFNLLMFRSALAQKQVPVVTLGTQPRNMAVAKQQALKELDRLLKPRLAPCLVELYSHLVDNNGNLSSQYDSGDGVHLNDAGHKVVLSRLLTVVHPG